MDVTPAIPVVPDLLSTRPYPATLGQVDVPRHASFLTGLPGPVAEPQGKLTQGAI